MITSPSSADQPCPYNNNNLEYEIQYKLCIHSNWNKNVYSIDIHDMVKYTNKNKNDITEYRYEKSIMSVSGASLFPLRTSLTEIQLLLRTFWIKQLAHFKGIWSNSIICFNILFSIWLHLDTQRNNEIRPQFCSNYRVYRFYSVVQGRR